LAVQSSARTRWAVIFLTLDAALRGDYGAISLASSDVAGHAVTFELSKGD
jgi:hypothetical protein